jgi:hypothetical protein
VTISEWKNSLQLVQSQEDELTADINATLSMTDNVMPKVHLAPEDDEQSLSTFAEMLGFLYVNLREASIDDAILTLIPAEFARKNDVMPLKLTRSHLTVARANPRRQDIFHALGFITDLTTDIHQHALASGMIPLTYNALLRARAKEISLAEVYRIRLD